MIELAGLVVSAVGAGIGWCFRGISARDTMNAERVAQESIRIRTKQLTRPPQP